MTTTLPTDTGAADAFGISVDWAKRQVIAAGPIDKATAMLLMEAINVLRRTSPGPITVDLRPVSRLNLAGMLVLDEVCSLQSWSGSTVSFRVTEPIALDLLRTGYGPLIGQPYWRRGATAPVDESDEATARTEQT